MAAKSPVVLILGAGPNIGQAVARTFASKGYKVAIASRSLKEADSTDNQLNIPSDFSKTDDVVNAFAKVNKVFGIPSVVVYNVSASTFTPADDPFALSFADFSRDTTINIHSAFVAAQQAVSGFAQLPASASRTFIYTGNVLNIAILPRFISQGIGKFYYADERKADGSPKYRVDGDAHANLFWELAQAETQGPWLQTFVQGVGYKKFNSLP
ncbi:hypothetical protein BU16DRAFT_596931 [Lophium mytilinum]|uniref:Short-chain dehydrogenase n=1 Tax=Lophium mytilinum TaxID=390894 RepID=A0A6A6QEQ1_9PEZI|nr:hypothetical protein BU16DRAFT_596931 [Lophium mytilinum]